MRSARKRWAPSLEKSQMYATNDREVMSLRNPGVETRIQRDSVVHNREVDDRETKAYAILEKKARLYDKLSMLG